MPIRGIVQCPHNLSIGCILPKIGSIIVGIIVSIIGSIGCTFPKIGSIIVGTIHDDYTIKYTLARTPMAMNSESDVSDNGEVMKTNNGADGDALTIFLTRLTLLITL